MEIQKRLHSLDALRGFDMLFIMGLSSFVVALCSLFPGGADCWLAQTMRHVEWHGFAHHDTIFPLFLFLAGVSFPFSYAKQCSKGTSRRQIYLKILYRAATLILLGLVYNGLFKCDFANLRICSVLGRIGVAWAAAALLYINLGRAARITICGAILIYDNGDKQSRHDKINASSIKRKNIPCKRAKHAPRYPIALIQQRNQKNKLIILIVRLILQ